MLENGLIPYYYIKGIIISFSSMFLNTERWNTVYKVLKYKVTWMPYEINNITNISEAHLGFCQISTVELICENS